MKWPRTFNVRQVKEPSPTPLFWQRGSFVLIVVVLTVVAVALLWFWFIYPRTDVAPQPSAVAGVAVGYQAPQFLSVDDVATVQVTVLNISGEPLTATVSLVFEPGPPVMAGEKGASAHVEKLSPGARATVPLTFIVSQRPDDQPVVFRVRVARPDVAQISDSDSIAVTVVPFIRQLGLMVTAGIALVGSLGGLV
ncbi:MAG: hypothetical protein ACT4QE_23655 [Anaerolineales bacterium]